MLVAHGRDGNQYAVLFDAGQKLGVEVGDVTHVELECQAARVEVFQGADGLAGADAVGDRGGVGHDWTFLCEGQASACPPVLFAFWH